MKLARISFIFILLSSSLARAGYLIEPYLGYASGGTSIEVTPTSNFGASTATFKGTEFGMRMGVKVGWFWLAVDPSWLMGNDETTYASGTTATFSRRQTSIYGDIGFDLPARVRVWAGASLYSEAKLTGSGASEQTQSSNGWKVGLGYQLFRYLGVNLEYKLEKPTKAHDSVSGDIDIKSNFSKFESSRTVFSISVIF